jgi:hypothetical protein
MNINKKLLNIFKKVKTTSDEYTYTCSYINDLVEDVYSNNEVKTNKVWVNGKPIYRRAFTFTDLTQIPQITTVLDEPISLQIMVKDSGSGVWRTIPWCFNSLSPEYMGGAYVSSNGYINWQIGSGLSNFTKGNAIVEYTKTTD